MVLGSAISALLRSLLEMQILGLHPRLLIQNMHLTRSLGDYTHIQIWKKQQQNSTVKDI